LLGYYVWLIIELGFYAGVLISAVLFLLFRSQMSGVILDFREDDAFSEKSDFLEANAYHLDLIISFAAPMVVSMGLLILNSNMKNDLVDTT